jgi:hypothetical protein
VPVRKIIGRNHRKPGNWRPHEITADKASSLAGLRAKAVAIRVDNLIVDSDQHQHVAVSLADDLVRLGPKAVA